MSIASELGKNIGIELSRIIMGVTGVKRNSNVSSLLSTEGSTTEYPTIKCEQHIIVHSYNYSISSDSFGLQQTGLVCGGGLRSRHK